MHVSASQLVLFGVVSTWLAALWPVGIGLVVAVILILGGLQFFPAFALGPIVEHLLMFSGATF